MECLAQCTKKKMLTKEEIRTMVVLLFLLAAILMPVAQGLCFSRPYADCPRPSSLEWFSAGHGSPSVTGQEACCTPAPHTARSRGCRCEPGGQAAAVNVTVTLPAPGKRDVPSVDHEGYRYRIQGRGYQDLFSLPLKFFSRPVSLALTVVQTTVLLI